MGRKFIAIQPNGLYAIYSSFIDTFSEYNLSKEDVLKYCRENFNRECVESLGDLVEPNCASGDDIYALGKNFVPVVKLADAIPHVLANNETTASIQEKLREMGYKYWDRVVLGSGDTPEDVEMLLERINGEIAKILYHNNVSLEVLNGKVVIKDKIFGERECETNYRFEPQELKPNFEIARKENYYYTD